MHLPLTHRPRWPALLLTLLLAAASGTALAQDDKRSAALREAEIGRAHV